MPVGRLEAVAERELGIPVIAFGSARSAIAAVLQAAKPTSGRVVLPAYTCVAVPNALQSAGVRRVWVDIAGPNLDPDLTAAALSPGDGLIAQHTYGVLVRPGLIADARRRGAFVIEDRAHRFDGADIEGDAVVYSLEHSKVVSGGQGGLVWVRDPALAAEVGRIKDRTAPVGDRAARQILRTSALQSGLARLGPRSRVNGLARRLALRLPYLSAPAQTADELAGHGVRLTALHPALAEIAIASVARSGRTIDHRRSIADRYRARLGELVPAWLGAELALVRMPVLVDDADAVTARLRRSGWDVGPRWFNAPVHPRGSISDYQPGTAPNAEKLASTVLTLPTHPLIDATTADRLADAVLAASAS
ncbi:MAG: DegT/DnrJ/EryC1/StrS family aminotransferase [Chloroflexi bacterium]|nr:DegT/DnrJ/EryC1/StrS family aminotransferase [Chloroflexota bacterium]